MGVLCWRTRGRDGSHSERQSGEQSRERAPSSRGDRILSPTEKPRKHRGLLARGWGSWAWPGDRRVPAPGLPPVSAAPKGRRMQVRPLLSKEGLTKVTITHFVAKPADATSAPRPNGFNSSPSSPSRFPDEPSGRGEQVGDPVPHTLASLQFPKDNLAVAALYPVPPYLHSSLLTYRPQDTGLTGFFSEGCQHRTVPDPWAEDDQTPMAGLSQETRMMSYPGERGLSLSPFLKAFQVSHATSRCTLPSCRVFSTPASVANEAGSLHLSKLVLSGSWTQAHLHSHPHPQVPGAEPRDPRDIAQPPSLVSSPGKQGCERAASRSCCQGERGLRVGGAASAPGTQ